MYVVLEVQTLVLLCCHRNLLSQYSRKAHFCGHPRHAVSDDFVFQNTDRTADIGMVFLLYVFVYVLNGPFWKRSSFYSIHTDAVWYAGELSFDDQWVPNWLWKQIHTRDIGNFWYPHGRTSYGFVELTDAQSTSGTMGKCTAFLLQIEARSLRFYLRVSLIWITVDEVGQLWNGQQCLLVIL